MGAVNLDLNLTSIYTPYTWNLKNSCHFVIVILQHKIKCNIFCVIVRYGNYTIGVVLGLLPNGISYVLGTYFYLEITHRVHFIF